MRGTGKAVIVETVSYMASEIQQKFYQMMKYHFIKSSYNRHFILVISDEKT